MLTFKDYLKWMADPSRGNKIGVVVALLISLPLAFGLHLAIKRVFRPIGGAFQLIFLLLVLGWALVWGFQTWKKN